MYMYIHHMYIKETESIGQLTDYVSPRYGGHVAMEGYEQTYMGNKK